MDTTAWLTGHQCMLLTFSEICSNLVLAIGSTLLVAHGRMGPMLEISPDSSAAAGTALPSSRAASFRGKPDQMQHTYLSARAGRWAACRATTCGQLCVVRSVAACRAAVSEKFFCAGARPAASTTLLLRADRCSNRLVSVEKLVQPAGTFALLLRLGRQPKSVSG
jgi:hypothetical protein